MNILRNLLGPKSKYDKSIPYLYEARIPVEGLQEVHHSYMADTICALIEKLHNSDVDPTEVRVFEIYHDREVEIADRFWLTPHGQWLFKPDICRAFEEHYKGHIQEHRCSFEDRANKGRGPY